MHHDNFSTWTPECLYKCERNPRSPPNTRQRPRRSSQPPVWFDNHDNHWDKNEIDDNYNGGGDELMMRAVKNQAVYIKNSLFAKYHLNPPLHWHWKLPGVFKHSCKDLLDTVWYLRRFNNSYNELLLIISRHWVSPANLFFHLRVYRDRFVTC